MPFIIKSNLPLESLVSHEDIRVAGIYQPADRMFQEFFDKIFNENGEVINLIGDIILHVFVF